MMCTFRSSVGCEGLWSGSDELDREDEDVRLLGFVAGKAGKAAMVTRRGLGA